MKLPIIGCPFSVFGDEVEGATPDEIAHNLAAGTRIELSWRRKPRRPCPDLRQAFRGCKLGDMAKLELLWVTQVYARLAPKPQLQEAA